MRFLEVGRNPDIVERHYFHQFLSDADVLVHFDCSLTDNSCGWRTNNCIAEFEVCLVELCLAYSRLGNCLNALSGGIGFSFCALLSTHRATDEQTRACESCIMNMTSMRVEKLRRADLNLMIMFAAIAEEKASEQHPACS
jgi:hypothetical protein